MDLGIEVILSLFSNKGLKDLFEYAKQNDLIKTENAKRIHALSAIYLKQIDQVIHFLQGKNQSFTRQLCANGFLPQASRFNELDNLDWAFGSMGIQDKAKHLATLFLEDLSDFIIESVDPHFGFSRYAERLGMSANTFDELNQELNALPSYIDLISLGILERKLAKHKPKLVCFTVPFPGNLYSAFRAAQYIKKTYPEIRIAMGGGFPNTELRDLNDPRVFDYFDFISIDDGELPIELLHEYVINGNIDISLKRTFFREDGKVKYHNSSPRSDYKQRELGCPDYSDLNLEHYISVIEVANPMHSLWSDGRWLKLTMAHGCYWGKCTFCDISLDYIKLYEPIAAGLLVDRMEEMISQTGERGFHFVDEAAPPALMRSLALEIIRRGLNVTWWTNIRFEKSFSRNLCRLLSASGCIAVSGGLEVASDRLLALIEKGVTVEQVAQVTQNFTESGIMVHAYLMYGYPTQTVQETIDSLEMVRQLFELGVLQSGFWHQFALTAHSPVGMNPEKYGVTPVLKEIRFANNDIQFTDKTGIDHNRFSAGLKKSLFNYMHGIGFDYPLQFWFEEDIPKTLIRKNQLEKSLEKSIDANVEGHAKIIWLGSNPNITITAKKGQEIWHMTFYEKTNQIEINMDPIRGRWLQELFEKTNPREKKLMSLAAVRASYESEFGDFEDFWKSEKMELLRELGLLIL